MKHVCLGYDPCNDFAKDKLSPNGFNKSAIDTVISIAQEHLKDKLGDLDKLGRGDFAVLFVSCGNYRAKYVIGNTSVAYDIKDKLLNRRRERCNNIMQNAICEPDKATPSVYINEEIGLCIAASGTEKIESMSIHELLAEELIRRWVG